MLPWRPDKAMAMSPRPEFRAFHRCLFGKVSGVAISKFCRRDRRPARMRHKFFDLVAGCRLSDHGIESSPRLHRQIDAIFNKVYGGQALTRAEVPSTRTAMMVRCRHGLEQAGRSSSATAPSTATAAHAYVPSGWVRYGLRLVGDFTVGKSMAQILRRPRTNSPRLHVYNLNPRDNELVAYIDQ